MAVRGTKFNRVFNHAARSSLNVIPEADKLERLMRSNDALNELSYHTAPVSRDILAQKAEIMEAWTQSLKDRQCEDATNVEEAVRISDKE